MGASVVVPTYGRPQSLKRCIQALAQQTSPPAEVIVVTRTADRATYASLHEGAASHPNLSIRPVFVERPGHHRAINAGLAAATGSIVCLTDDDAEPLPDWLERIQRTLTDASIGGVGGRDIVYNQDGLDDGVCRRVGDFTWYGRMIGNHHLRLEPPTVRRVSLLKGVNMAFRRDVLGDFRLDDVLRARGTFHTEVDICFHVTSQRKVLLYDPAICVIHRPAPRTWGAGREDFRSNQFESAFNLTYLLLKHLPVHRKMAFLVYTFLFGQRLALGFLTFPYVLTRRDNMYGRTLGPRLQAMSMAGKTAGVLTYLARKRRYGRSKEVKA